MKAHRLLNLFLPVIIVLFALPGCEKNEADQTGLLNFGMSPILESTLKSLDSYHYNVHAALVTIENESGMMVYEKEYIEFYSFGESFVTKSISLNVGKYALTEFLLVDSSRNVIWASPMEGSRLAEMVNDPLPINFRVSANNTTQLYPEVVKVANYNPDDFGYVNFHVKFVDNFCIGIFLESYCTNSYPGPGGGVDSSIYADSAIYLDNGMLMPYFASRLQIFSDGKMLKEIYLNPGENRITIPKGHERYRMLLFDCGNQVCFNQAFGLEELRHFACAEGEQLYINCEASRPEITFTPEDISEPTIEQGVFGKITEPAMDSTMMEDYAVQGMQTDLYIFKAEPGDTLFYSMMNADCYFYPELYMKPLAIVRSNTSGIFQLPLEEGKYNYLVKTNFGFYIDAFKSSQVPGAFAVNTGEVTMVNIYVIPCAVY